MKSMHQQFKAQNEKLKEFKQASDILVEIFHYVKLLEIETLNYTHEIKSKVNRIDQVKQV